MVVRVRTTARVKLFWGVIVRWEVAGFPLLTVTVEERPPSTVRVKAPLLPVAPAFPVPVRGMVAGEFWSVLETVKTPLREPAAVGVKVTVTEQLAPGTRVVRAQGMVMA